MRVGAVVVVAAAGKVMVVVWLAVVMAAQGLMPA